MQENKFKSEKGSIAVYAIATILSFLMILGGIFFSSSIIRKNQLRTLIKIKDVYSQDIGRADEIAEDIKEKIPVDIATVTSTEHDTLKAKDSLGNIVTVPKGFKVVEGAVGEEITVQNGAVIEDSAGNQFVWIPVGNVNIINDDGSKGSVNIELARYDFTTDASTVEGSRTIKQLAKDYATDMSFTPTGLDGTVTEYATRENYDGVVSSGTDGLNAIAKDLGGFVLSVKNNGGYYLARYEASYGSGYNASGSDDVAKYENAKPLSKKSTAYRTGSDGSMNYVEGTLWNYITQLNASKVCKNMYKENKDINGNSVGVESDLVNSYAWDTAIIYIEKMKTANNNYANANRGSNTELKNTGDTGDVKCNIYDMAVNTVDWTTEYCTGTSSSFAGPCVYRGGYYGYAGFYTANRSNNGTTASFDTVSFRPIIYVK